MADGTKKTPERKANEIWVSSSVGNDFKIDVKHIPRVGDLFEIGGQELKVGAVVYQPLSTDYEKINKCSVLIVLENPSEQS